MLVHHSKDTGREHKEPARLNQTGERPRGYQYHQVLRSQKAGGAAQKTVCEVAQRA